jgi:hypothetical protein
MQTVNFQSQSNVKRAGAGCARASTANQDGEGIRRVNKMTTKNKTVKPDPETRVRKCLMCRRTFESRWAGNRICKKCKSSAAYRTA